MHDFFPNFKANFIVLFKIYFWKFIILIIIFVSSSLPSEKKIFLLNALLDEVISENNFRTLYDEKLAQVEGVTKKLKCLQANMCKFNKEMASLKLYKTEKLPNANELLGLWLH